MDGGCIHRSYFSDYTRCAAVAKASLTQRETYQRVLEVLDRMLEVVRTGTAASAVFATARDAAARIGLDPAIPTRVGHGIGLDLTEPPSLAADASTVMEEGMALAVEVGVLTDEGWFHLEENVVVRGTGCEFLSQRTPRELPVVGVA
jgi:Xaa-Pro aminopeptidase